jgi:hypothetical protein
MNLKEKLKALLGEFNKPEVNVELKFVEATLVDGTKVISEGETLEVGQALLVITEEGNIPAPDGEHELESGQIVETEGGLIKEIKQKEAEVEIEVEAGKDKEEKYQVSEEDVLGLTNLIENLQMELGQLKSENALLKGEFESLKKMVEEMVGQPAVDSVKEEFNKIGLKTSENSDRVERFMRIKQMIGE